MKLTLNAAVEYKGQIFFSAVYMNGLFKIDIATKEIFFLKKFDKEEIYIGIHRTAFLYKNDAWFVPEHGNYIAVVNLDTLEITYKELLYKENNLKSIVNVKYYSGAIFNEKHLFLVPSSLDTLVIYNLETKDIEQSYIVRDNEKECFLYGFYNSFTQCIQLDPFKGEYSVVLDLQTQKISRKEYVYSNELYMGMHLDAKNQKVWRSPNKADHILVEDLLNGKSRKICLEKNSYENNKIYSNCIIQKKNDIFVFGWEIDKVIKINCENYQTNYYKLENKNILDNLYLEIYSNEHILVSAENNYLYLYSEVKNEFERIPLQVEYKKIVCDLRQYGMTLSDLTGTDILDERLVGLECFMKELVDGRKSEIAKEKIGDNIWNIVNRENN